MGKGIETTRAARRRAEREHNSRAIDYYDYFSALFHNSVTFDDLPEDLPKRYLLEKLMTGGKIAHDYETGLWLPCDGVGIDIYGLPTTWRLYGANGKIITRSPEKCCVLRINDNATPITPYLWQQADLLAEIDLAIAQNLEAIKTMTVMEFPDESQLLTAINLAESRRIGASIAYVNRRAVEGVSVKAMGTGAQYLVDRLQDARGRVLTETLQRLGISSANTDKREQVQAAEVVGSQGTALDTLFTFIDTFNYDAERGGLSIRARANTSVVELLNVDPVEGGLNDTPENAGAQGQTIEGIDRIAERNPEGRS